MKSICLVLLLAFIAPSISAQTIKLPPPQKNGGKPLMEALNDRQTGRIYKPDALSIETISNLLWAANGINRPDGKRTAPSASNKQELDIYVVTAERIYFYNPQEHSLEPRIEGDLRAQTGTQAFVGTAPLNLVYVTNYSKMGAGLNQFEKNRLSWCNTAFIAQNVYLFCASEGLACVVRGLVPREELGKAMKLTTDQEVTLAQTVGWPQE
jgi:nitroreductase